ncbi:regulatory protein RecX [Sinanaerobacter sp. ZZT-01]|uniref:regulatory protein RecX n=1 Tax=Sinanaerobacter sp. ZZT-01 TaxID=3111540 RepID=UPI002D790E7E|nr:regulatory protein RecX [Sinanaerobacter sp. ZZT-01]WRR93484.1 regulatory protein RecX [Sinanaerobacter sp. ZZT-01]
MQKEKTSFTKSAKEEAMNYLGYRDHSVLEVKNRLKQKEYCEHEIEECIKFLEESGFVNDQRYCEAYLRYALGKGKGPLRLRQELLKKGIKEETIQECMKENIDEELLFSNAMKQVNKITGDVAIDKKMLSKLGRRLSYLGYPAELVYRILNQIRGSD